MPSHYAHYRFGVKALELLPEDAKRAVRRFRSLYDAGLHGPDIFFYHNFLIRDKYAALAREYHFPGDREAVRQQAIAAALELILECF
jgi:hypothetical protein